MVVRSVGAAVKCSMLHKMLSRLILASLDSLDRAVSAAARSKPRVDRALEVLQPVPVLDLNDRASTTLR
jgi:hypothetical protein